MRNGTSDALCMEAHFQNQFVEIQLLFNVYDTPMICQGNWFFPKHLTFTQEPAWNNNSLLSLSSAPIEWITPWWVTSTFLSCRPSVTPSFSPLTEFNLYKCK